MQEPRVPVGMSEEEEERDGMVRVEGRKGG